MSVILSSVVLFCFAIVKSKTNEIDGTNAVIFRGDQDKFTRKIACYRSKAVCFDESCTYCKCRKGQTLVRSGRHYGKCFSNKLLVYATSLGCEKFSDGSPIILLNKTKCEENLKCLGEKTIDLRKIGCILSLKKSQYLHNGTWKTLQIKNGSFNVTTMNKTSLKWDLNKTPNQWKGLLVQVQFKCEGGSRVNRSETAHCIVVKYTGNFKDFDGKEEYGKPNRNHVRITRDTTNSDVSNISETDSISKPSSNSKNIKKRGSSDVLKNIVIVIWVCDFVLLCITVVIGKKSFSIIDRCTCLYHSCTINTGRNLAPMQPRSQVLSPPLVVSVNKTAVSNSNHLSPRGLQQYEIPCEPPYENADAADFTCDNAHHDGPLRSNGEESVDPDKTGDYVNERQDTGKGDTDDEAIEEQDTEEGGRQNEGYVSDRPNAEERDTNGQPLYELPYSHQYENPDQFQSHLYECPSLVDMKVGYTPLINDEKGSDKAGTNVKDNKAANNDDAPDGDYAPIERALPEENESEYVGYTPLINDEKRRDEAGTTTKDDKAANNDDALDGDYAPKERPLPEEDGGD